MEIERPDPPGGQDKPCHHRTTPDKLAPAGPLAGRVILSYAESRPGQLTRPPYDGIPAPAVISTA